jgi:hypothetical protein
MDQSPHPLDAQVRRDLTSLFEAKLDGMVARTLALNHQRIVPHHHFAAASSECIDCYRAGHFIACITLVQAVAEGIARHACSEMAIEPSDYQRARVKRLHASGAITDTCAVAFLLIIAAHRNDFHHMNPQVPTDPAVVERLTAAALADLAMIEGEIFGCDFVDGRLLPRQPRYWTLQADGAVPAFLRMM